MVWANKNETWSHFVCMVWVQKRFQRAQVVFPLWGLLFLESLNILRWGLKIKKCQHQVIYIDHGKYFNVNYNKVGLHGKIKDVLWSYGSLKHLDQNCQNEFDQFKILIQHN
jgi:hypothetical protein